MERKINDTPAIPAETSGPTPAPSMTEVYFYEVRSVHNLQVLPPFRFANTLDEILKKWQSDTADPSFYTTPIQHGMLPQGFKILTSRRG